LTIYNNEFILDSARIGSEMINWMATNTIGNYCLSKSHAWLSRHIVFIIVIIIIIIIITACAQNVLLQHECKW